MASKRDDWNVTLGSTPRLPFPLRSLQHCPPVPNTSNGSESELHELGQGSCSLLPSPAIPRKVSNDVLARARLIYPSQLWVVFGLQGRSLGVASYYKWNHHLPTSFCLQQRDIKPSKVSEKTEEKEDGVENKDQRTGSEVRTCSQSRVASRQC